MSMSVDQVIGHLKDTMSKKQAVVAAPGGQPPMPPGMDPTMGGAGMGLPPVGASPGGAIDPLIMGGGAPPMMADPAAAGMMPPAEGMMPPAEGMMPPAEGGDPIASLQQEVSDLRGLMQEIIDGQAAIIEHLIGGASAPAPPMEAPMEAPMAPPR